MATNDAAVVSVITAIEAVVKDSCLQVKAPRIVKLQELGRVILQKQREADRETASQFSDFSTALCKTIREFVTAHSGKHRSLPALRTKIVGPVSSRVQYQLAYDLGQEIPFYSPSRAMQHLISTVRQRKVV